MVRAKEREKPNLLPNLQELPLPKVQMALQTIEAGQCCALVMNNFIVWLSVFLSTCLSICQSVHVSVKISAHPIVINTALVE